MATKPKVLSQGPAESLESFMARLNAMTDPEMDLTVDDARYEHRLLLEESRKQSFKPTRPYYRCPCCGGSPTCLR